jgi:hypothetical protein
MNHQSVVLGHVPEPTEPMHTFVPDEEEDLVPDDVEDMLPHKEEDLIPDEVRCRS